MQFNILSGFLGKAAHDSRLLHAHICLYTAMLSVWEQTFLSGSPGKS